MRTLGIVWTGEKREPVMINERLEKAGEEIKIIGFLLGKDQEKLDLNIELIHQAVGTKSKILLRGILKDNASVSSFNLININKGAKGAEALQNSKFLLFDNAKGNIKPYLEIEEKEVKAKHSAVVRRVDEKELFYLQSRGLSKKEAVNLMIEGFLESVIKEFSSEEQESLRKVLKNYVES